MIAVTASRHFLATAATRLAVAGSSFGFSMLAARFLGPDDAGSLFFALALLVGASLVARLGNDVNLIWSTGRLLQAGECGKANSLVALGIVLGLFISALIIPIPWLWQHFFISPEGPTNTVDAVKLAMLTLPAIVCAALFSGSLKAIGQMSRAVLLDQGGMYLIAMPLLLFLIVLDRPINIQSILLPLLASAWLLAVSGGLWWFNSERRQHGFTLLDSHESRSFLQSSFNLTISALASYCITLGNILLVGLMTGEGEVGLYAVSERIATLQFFLLSVVFVVAPQRLSSAFNSGKLAQFREEAQRSSLVATLGALPLCVIGLLFAEQLLAFLGNGFEEASLTLRLLCLAYLLPALLGAGDHILSLTGHNATLRNISLGSALLQLPTVSTMAWYCGAEGAAGALLGVYVVRYLAMQFAIRKLLGFYIVPRFSEVGRQSAP